MDLVMSKHHIYIVFPTHVRKVLASANNFNTHYCAKCGFSDLKTGNLICNGSHTIKLYSPIEEFTIDDLNILLYCQSCGPNYESNQQCSSHVPMNQLTIDFNQSSSTSSHLDSLDRRNFLLNTPQYSQASQDEASSLIKRKYQLSGGNNHGLKVSSMHISGQTKKHGSKDQQKKNVMLKQNEGRIITLKKSSAMGALVSKLKHRDDDDDHEDEENDQDDDEDDDEDDEDEEDEEPIYVQPSQSSAKSSNSTRVNASCFNLLYVPYEMRDKPHKDSQVMTWLIDHNYYRRNVEISWPTIINDIRMAYPVKEERVNLQFEIGNAVKKECSNSIIETFYDRKNGVEVLWTNVNIFNGYVGCMKELRKRMRNITSFVVRVR